ncbi:hypothetical protein H5410_040421, partial [Solanum commersonii]
VFEAKHRHYLAKRNKTVEKTKKRRPEDRLMHSARKDQVGDEKEQSTCYRIVSQNNTISPNDSEYEAAEGKKDQVGDEDKQSVCRRTVLQSSTISPNDLEHEDVKGKS